LNPEIENEVKLDKNVFGKIAHALYEEGINDPFLLNRCVAAAVEAIRKVLSEEKTAGGEPSC